MFNNVGKKLKGMATIVFACILILAIVIAMVIVVPLMVASEDLVIYVGGFFLIILIIAVGFFVAWIFVILLYAFGELVDTNQIQVRQNDAMIKLLNLIAKGDKPSEDITVLEAKANEKTSKYQQAEGLNAFNISSNRNYSDAGNLHAMNISVNKSNSNNLEEK